MNVVGYHRPGPLARHLIAAGLVLAAALAQPVAHAQSAQASVAAAQHPTRGLWQDVKAAPAARSATGATPAIQPLRYRAATLDRSSLAALAATAPMERTQAARQSPVVLSLPDPAGGFQRFEIVDSPVMEPGLAARHPHIRTYAGRGVDDPAANIRISISQLGLSASVRSPKGNWYIDPYYHLDDSLYVAYWGRDLRPTRARGVEGLMNEPQVIVSRGTYHAAETVQVRAYGYAPGTRVTVTVRNPKVDSFPRQVHYAVVSPEGTVSVDLVAEPYRTAGSYDVTITDGRAVASAAYRVVADDQPTNASTGNVLRTYRLALLSDPAYATYFGGSANVTAAKVQLINRVTQIYEYETAIRLVLIANNDLLNLDTAPQFSGTNGPCGATACFPSASVSCSSATLTRNRQVIGLLVGASAFDIGHIGVGAGGGGIASLGVVGGNLKAQGCTGLPTPVGDLFAVDYVAHEMGHQFAANHTFNGINGSCAGGNRSAANSVEPGSGTSIMAYAGICGTDNTQPHSDPYWSQRSFDEITTYVNGAESNISEIQLSAITGFTLNGQQFQIRYNGNDSIPIVRGTNFTATDIQNAIQGIAGWPAGGTAAVGTVADSGFQVTFGGTLAGVDASLLQLVNCTGGCSGYFGELAKGGLTTRGGSTVTPTGNSAPVVTTPASYTIPLRTPFALTGSATDANGDPLTYMWEQTDRGGTAGTGLVSNTKTNGPLFRQFGTYANVTSAGTLQYNSPGLNLVGTNPTRVFPDLLQIIANNTNAETGACPAASATPTIPQIDCFSEFLPTADYVGFAGVNASPLSLNFKLTVRDGRGGVNSGTTQLLLATGAGPFLVTSPNTAVTYDSVSTQTVTWNVANTNVAPVNTANVKITMSVDGGLTYPYVLAASTPNNGSASVTIPNVGTTQGRVKVEAIDNVYFDISNADFTVRLLGDTNGDNRIDCGDINIVKRAIGTRVGDPGFDPRADVNNDGVVDLRDLAFVSQRITVPQRCPALPPV